jgi:hypothetical protein
MLEGQRIVIDCYIHTANCRPIWHWQILEKFLFYSMEHNILQLQKGPSAILVHRRMNYGVVQIVFLKLPPVLGRVCYLFNIMDTALTLMHVHLRYPLIRCDIVNEVVVH